MQSSPYQEGSGGVSGEAQAQDAGSGLRKVVVVFKTHFDLGFTDLPDGVMSLYSGPMFRQVEEVMSATSDQPPGLRYTWTVPAWVMSQFLHPPTTPEVTRREALRLALEGRLVWHAWPFTTHTAFCGLEDLVRGLHISRSLSEELGRWPLAAKQTDVPGHTWILPTLLFRAGVRFLHLGCNSGSHPPHVPRLFWWEGPDGSRLLTFYSAGGYGTTLLPPPEWALDTWLSLQHTIDNHGPHTPEQQARIRSEILAAAPGAEVVFGELGDFAQALLGRPEQLSGLPVLPFDLADTWIHGVGTMPREVARVRQLRARLANLEQQAAFQEWPGVREHAADPDFPLARSVAPLVDAAYEQLMLFGEHTWGLDVKSTIKRAYGDSFSAARATEPYRRLEESWSAKAAYVGRAEAAYSEAARLLVEAGVPAQAGATAGNAAARSTAAQTGQEHMPGGRVIENRRLRLQVDPSAGGIVSLYDKQSGREWVDKAGGEPFGGYRYDIYSASDIAEFVRAYGLFFQDWFVQDFGKTGYPEDLAHGTWYARDFTPRISAAVGTGLLLEGGRLLPAGADGSAAPEERVDLQISLPDAGEAWVDITCSIRGKNATPLAESAMLAFPLRLPKPLFRIGQTGSVIDPFRDIASGANRNLWCADGWLDASDERAGLGLLPLDMPLVSIGTPGIFRFDPERAVAAPVLYSHLFNTQWGTNFPQWHEGDFSFRVRLVLHAGGWRTGRLWHAARRAQGFSLPGSTGGAPLLNLPDGLVLLSLRPRHDGRGLVVRFWDALGLGRDATVEVRGAVASVRHCDLMERPMRTSDVLHDAARGCTQIRMHIAPHAVETLLVEFDTGSGAGNERE